MILDKMENLSLYAAISPNFAKAIAFLNSHDLAALPVGRNEVDGDQVFVNKMNNTYEKVNEGSEVHHDYADLQIVLEGAEGMGYGTAEQTGSYDAEKDLALNGAVDTAMLKMTPGYFVIFFPGEDHAPGSKVTDDGKVTKLVGKIRKDW